MSLLRLLSVLIVVLLSLPAYAGIIYEDKEFGFQATIPDNFVASDNALRALKNLKYGDTPEAEAISSSLKNVFKCFRLIDDPKDAKGYVQIWFESLERPISREPIEQKQLPNGLTVQRVAWQGYNVDCVIDRRQLGVVQHVVQIPLRIRAIQVRLSGPPDKEPTLVVARDQLLAGLVGKSNWADKSPSFQDKVAAISRVLVYAFLCLLGLWFTLRTLLVKKRVA